MADILKLVTISIESDFGILELKTGTPRCEALVVIGNV